MPEVGQLGWFLLVPWMVPVKVADDFGKQTVSMVAFLQTLLLLIIYIQLTVEMFDVVKTVLAVTV